MTFAEASTTRLPFGKYCGVSLDDVARTDEGLRYLDWLRGRDLYGRLKEALDVYLDDSAIAGDMERLVGDKP